MPSFHPIAFVFLFIFDFLSYYERKNPFGLVRAFKEAFSGDDSVELVLKTMNSDREPEARAALELEMDGANIRLIDRYMARQEVFDSLFGCRTRSLEVRVLAMHEGTPRFALGAEETRTVSMPRGEP